MNGSDPSVCLIGLVNPTARSPWRSRTRNKTRCLYMLSKGPDRFTIYSPRTDRRPWYKVLTHHMSSVGVQFKCSMLLLARKEASDSRTRDSALLCGNSSGIWRLVKASVVGVAYLRAVNVRSMCMVNLGREGLITSCSTTTQSVMCHVWVQNKKEGQTP